MLRTLRTAMTLPALVIVLLAGLLAGTAHASVSSPSRWDRLTCSAFASWDRHPDQHRAVRVLRYSRHADRYLLADGWDWYHHRDAAWTRIVRLDCTTSPDE